jgi:Fe-S oxidoreductase
MEAKYDFERKYREQILRCSRCGFCQAVCPVYGATLRPGLNARGKMLLLKEVMDGRIDLSDELIETLFQCTTCASCTHNCPSGVQVPEIVKTARMDMVNIGSCHPAFTGMKPRSSAARRSGKPSTCSSRAAWASTGKPKPRKPPSPCSTS